MRQVLAGAVLVVAGIVAFIALARASGALVIVDAVLVGTGLIRYWTSQIRRSRGHRNVRDHHRGRRRGRLGSPPHGIREASPARLPPSRAGDLASPLCLPVCRGHQRFIGELVGFASWAGARQCRDGHADPALLPSGATALIEVAEFTV